MYDGYELRLIHESYPNLFIKDHPMMYPSVSMHFHLYSNLKVMALSQEYP
jgi:hypothetical protein